MAFKHLTLICTCRGVFCQQKGVNEFEHSKCILRGTQIPRKYCSVRWEEENHLGQPSGDA